MDGDRSTFKTADRWVGDVAWGANQPVRYNRGTDTVYHAARRQSVRHVDVDGGLARVPLCLCYMHDIDTVVLGTLDRRGEATIHGVVPATPPEEWAVYLTYDADKQTMFYSIPLSTLRQVKVSR